MIELRNISKKFSTKYKDVDAVNNINLSINDGEIFGIVGYSGAGKSTLLRIINQLEIQSSGELIIDNEVFDTRDRKNLRKKRQKIGMIFQNFNLLWSRNVFENIELPLEIAKVDKKKRKKRVEELISLVGLNGKENSYPSELSGGEKQRVGIARAIANNPKILLSDEATSALDPETTESILELLEKINKELNITIILITHQMEVVQRICQRVAIMSNGRIVEINDVKSIFENPTHVTTKKFVSNVDSGKNIGKIQKELLQDYPNGKILRLSFTGGNSKEAIIASGILKCNILVSILDSNITNSRVGPIGFTYIHTTDEENLDKFIDYLKENNVKVEVIN